jgi:hypothetical protein
MVSSIPVLSNLPTMYQKLSVTRPVTTQYLSIKRFLDSNPTLAAGAKWDHEALPYTTVAELDPSGLSKCNLCGSLIPK